MKKRNLAHLAVVVGLLLLTIEHAAGQIIVGPPEVSMPLWETFDDDPLGSSAPTVQGKSWHQMASATVEPDIIGNDYRVVDCVGYSSTTVNVTNGQGKEFTVSVEFEIQYLDTFGELPNDSTPYRTIGLTVMGDGLSYHPVDLQDSSKHQRLTFGNNISADTLAPVLGITYQMWMAGEYAIPDDQNSQFMFTAGLTDGETTLTLDWIGSPPSQEHVVGMSTTSKAISSGEAIIVDFDNFAIVPEPATLGLLLLGGLAVLRRRRSS